MLSPAETPLSWQAFGSYSNTWFEIGSSHDLGSGMASVPGDFSDEKSSDQSSTVASIIHAPARRRIALDTLAIKCPASLSPR
jgi:hypothetical protein